MCNHFLPRAPSFPSTQQLEATCSTSPCGSSRGSSRGKVIVRSMWPPEPLGLQCVLFAAGGRREQVDGVASLKCSYLNVSLPEDVLLLMASPRFVSHT